LTKTFVLLSLSLMPTFAQSLTQSERDYAISNLHATRKMFLDAVAGLSPAHWNFKPKPDRWSIAEIAEHLAITEDYIFQMITQKMLAGPAEPARRAEVKNKDRQVVREIADRSKKYTAPEVVRPTHRFASPEAIVEHFRESRDRNIAYVQTTQADLRDHFAAHPVAGLLDAYQWFLVLAAHTDRHVQQMKEIKADPNYPKS
jgi:uncharacterized damage-inducible protein DinB